MSFLENNGIEKEEISIAPPEVIDMQAERYVDRNVAYRYNATSVITVTSKNVDRVRKLMSGQAELLKQGIAITGGDYKYNVSYGIHRSQRSEAQNDRGGHEERSCCSREVCQGFGQ